MTPPRRRPWWKRLKLPADSSRWWPALRLVVLVAFMYHNASNFDWTEGKTIMAVALMEALGIRKRA